MATGNRRLASLAPSGTNDVKATFAAAFSASFDVEKNSGLS